MKLRHKCTLTTMLIIISIIFFSLANITEISKVEYGITVTKTNEGIAKFFEWIGIFLLALAIWVWRVELRITSIGPLTWPLPLEQQKPKDIQNRQALGVTRIQKELEQITGGNLEQLKSKVIEMFRTKQAIDEQEIASHLNIKINQAKLLLSLLLQEGKIRRDSVYKRFLYTPSNFPENLAIDKFIERIKSENKYIISKNRFIRVFGRYQIDAMVSYEQNQKNYDVLIEVKRFNRVAEMDKIVYGSILALDQVRQAVIEYKIKFTRFPLGYSEPDKLEYIKEIASRIITCLILIVEDKSDFIVAKELERKYSTVKDIFNNEILVFLL